MTNTDLDTAGMRSDIGQDRAAPSLDRTSQLVVALIVGLFLCACAATFQNTVDDAFISYRYARNLAIGRGLVFNIGERVEGFSNPLWVLILAAAQRVGLEPIIVSKIVGIASSVVTLLLTWGLARRHWRLNLPVAVAATLWVASNTGFVYYATAGLETSFYAMQVILLAWLLLEERWLAAACVCATLTLTRPEGVSFTAILILASLFGHRGGKTLLAAAIPVAAYLSLLAFRWLYFGHFVPNTFGAKVDTHIGLFSFLAFHTRSFLVYGASFSRTQLMEGLLMFPCALGAIMAVTGRRAVVPALLALLFGFSWISAGDWMPFSRFLVPALPFLAVCAFSALFWVQVTAARLVMSAAVIALGVAALGWNAATTTGAIRALNANSAFNPAMHSRPHVAIGDYLRSVGAPSDVVVTNEIGAIGYRSDLTIVDMLGLIDPEVPGLLTRPTLDEYVTHLLSKSPRFVLLNNVNLASDREMPAIHKAVFQELQRNGLYEQTRIVPLNADKHVLLFTRKP